MGFVKMVLETGEYSGVLKDMVCLSGGIIIEAVRVLEEKGFRVVVIEAMTKCMEKLEKFSKFWWFSSDVRSLFRCGYVRFFLFCKALNLSILIIYDSDLFVGLAA